MADSSGRSVDRSSKAPPRPGKIKTVRSQKILPNSPDDSPSKLGAAGESDGDPLPPLRSHTSGHVASKSTSDRRHKSADLAIRQRSQSASLVSSASRPPTAGGQALKLLPASSSAINVPRCEEDTKEQTKPVHPRPALSVANSGALSASTTARPPAHKITRPPRGQHIPFPPLQDPKDAPDVEPAPASGMYWSKASVSGSPHASLRSHTTTIIGSNIYVFGGCDSRTSFNSMYVLDADAFYWSVPHMVGEIPMPLRSMTCTAVGKKLVVFGGGDGPAYYNHVYVLDTLNFRWTKPRIVGDKEPPERRAHTACLYKNGIYVFAGGNGERALNDIWRLDVGDPTKMSWKLISSPGKAASDTNDYYPKARGYHTANMSGSKLIIFGGSDGGECFDDVWIYDVETHIWKAVSAPVTFRRLSHTATLVGSYLFVIGGHDGNDYCNDVLLFNLVTLTWDKRKVYGKAPGKRGYHGTVLHDSRLLVIGGFDGSEAFGDVSILELAVHAYYSQISHFTIDV